MNTGHLLGILTASLLFSGAGTARADVVTDWNGIMQSTVATSNAFAQSRSAAITQLAVFEAVNAIAKRFPPYIGTLWAPAGASVDAAAIAAAHKALVALHPAATASLDTAYAAGIQALPDDQSRLDGIAIGEAAANAMLALRAADGSTAIVSYVPGADPGDWRPTPPALLPALLPNWGQVMPFGIDNGAQYRSAPPPALTSGKYARDYDEVMTVGAVNSTERTQRLTDIAVFYASSAVQAWNPAARQVSAAQHRTTAENARAFAALNMAIADGLIAVMETKYYYNVWRPVTAIRLGDTDGNKRTPPDVSWLPLIATPPFPSYPSAHASASGAARAVLEELFGRDGFDVDLTSSTAPGLVLHYTAWEQITDDIDDARVYGGIHFRYDQEAGGRQGRQVGMDIVRTFLRGRPKCEE